MTVLDLIDRLRRCDETAEIFLTIDIDTDSMYSRNPVIMESNVSGFLVVFIAGGWDEMVGTDGG